MFCFMCVYVHLHLHLLLKCMMNWNWSSEVTKNLGYWQKVNNLLDLKSLLNRIISENNVDCFCMINNIFPDIQQTY